MRLTNLKVLGKPFTIDYVDEEHEGLKEGPDDKDPGFGRIHPEGQAIWIREGQPLESEQDTLLHEAIHAVDETLGLQMDERQVTLMATGLLAIFKDNPDFLDYLARTR